MPARSLPLGAVPPRRSPPKSTPRTSSCRASSPGHDVDGAYLPRNPTRIRRCPGPRDSRPRIELRGIRVADDRVPGPPQIRRSKAVAGSRAWYPDARGTSGHSPASTQVVNPQSATRTDTKLFGNMEFGLLQPPHHPSHTATRWPSTPSDCKVRRLRRTTGRGEVTSRGIALNPRRRKAKDGRRSSTATKPWPH